MTEEKALCLNCGAEVSEKVRKNSIDNFDGIILCYNCQQQVKAGELDVESIKKKKSTLEGYAGSAEQKESESKVEEKTEEAISANQIEEITKLQDELRGIVPMEKLLANTTRKYGVEHIENLTAEQADNLIKQLKELKKKHASTKKEITIEWDNIPAHVLLPKLRKALQYELAGEADSEGLISIKKKQGDEIDTHLTGDGICDCKDWENRGTSLNPCVHQVRVKYSDEEIKEKLEELQVDNEQNELAVSMTKEVQPQQQQQQPSVFGIAQLQPRLCEIGKIKIGELSDRTTASGYRLPRKLDHFVITTTLRDEEGNLLLDEEMNKKIGNNCRELDIYLCYDTPELNMPTFYAHFTKSKLQCIGDGRTALRTIDGDGNGEGKDKEEVMCNPRLCEAYQQKLCKPYGRLSVILSMANRIGGAYVFRTTSWHTIRNILTSMTFIRTITGGILAGLPLKMRLIPMTVQPRDLEHTVRIYTVNIEFGGDMSALMEAAKQEINRRMQLHTNMKQIEAAVRKEIAAQVREEAEEQGSQISGFEST